VIFFVHPLHKGGQKALTGGPGIKGGPGKVLGLAGYRTSLTQGEAQPGLGCKAGLGQGVRAGKARLTRPRPWPGLVQLNQGRL
jgi:hypothetical protein